MDEERSSVVVRPMEVRDAEAVSVLTGQLGYVRNAAEVLAWVKRLPERAGEQMAWVACAGNEVVGWVEASVERRLQTEAFALIGGLVVKEGVRGRGIGRLLCGAVEGWTRAIGVGALRVTSRSSRMEAHRFYLRGGYSQVKTSLVFEKDVRAGSKA